jgi:hypothetical protein
MARLALSYVAKTRRQSDQLPRVHFADTVIDYRDDNRQLWKFIEEGDEEEAFDPERKLEPGEELRGLPPRRYPEWDAPARPTGPTGPASTKPCIPSGSAGDIDRLLQKHAALAKQLKRLLDLLKPQDKVRIRYQEEGSELDLDVAIGSLIDYQQRRHARPAHQHEPPHRRSRHRRPAAARPVGVAQQKGRRGGGEQTVLELSQEAVSLLAWAIDCLGDPAPSPASIPIPATRCATSTSRAFPSAGTTRSKPAWPPCRPDGPRAWAPRCAMPAITWGRRRADKKHPAAADRRRTGRHRRHRARPPARRRAQGGGGTGRQGVTPSA